MADWAAAMTYNHPFWDAPSSADETAAWGLVQKGLAAKKMSPREKLYLNAVAALFKDAGAGPKAARDERDRKSTRLNSSHSQISYAVFCLKKKNQQPATNQTQRASTSTS